MLFDDILHEVKSSLFDQNKVSLQRIFTQAVYVMYINIVNTQGQRCGSEVGYDIGQGKQNSKKDKIKISCAD